MKEYIETMSGQKVWLPNPDPDSIQIEDIAHALSFQPRFAGHTRIMHSVAAHSLLVENIVHEFLGETDRIIRLQALLHDATEAYLCDIPSPFKSLIPQYKELEANLWRVISTRFGVPFEMDPLVKKADWLNLYGERDWLRTHQTSEWANEPSAEDKQKIISLIRRNLGDGIQSSPHIKGLFLSTFRALEK